MSDELLSPNHRTDAGVCKVWRAKHSGYRFILVMVAHAAGNLTPLVIYRGEVSGMNYVTTADDFHARFEPA